MESIPKRPKLEEVNVTPVFSSLQLAPKNVPASIQNVPQNQSPAVVKEYILSSERLNSIESTYDKSMGLSSCLSLWSLKNNVTQLSVDEILFIIRLFLPDSKIPKTARTLNKSEEKIKTIPVGKGKLYRPVIEKIWKTILALFQHS